MGFYRAFSIGVNKRRLIKVDENYINSIQEIIGGDYDAKDFYESIYLYEDSHLEQFEKSKSLAGIKGIKTDRIVFDFDSKKDPSLALNDAKEVVSRLKNDFDEQSIRLFYSGGKGFHVEVHLSENKLISREQFELITSKYANGLVTFDEKVKDEQRLFRLPLTKNLGSGRFKIPLTLEQLNTLDIIKIQKMSLVPNYDNLINIMDNWTLSSLPKNLENLKKEEKKVEILREEFESVERPNFTKNNTGLTPAKYALQEGYFEEGERNEASMILCATYKFLGYNKEVAYNMLKASLRLRSKRLGLPELSESDKFELWKTVVDYVYSDSYNGGTFSEEEGLLKKVKDRYKISDYDKLDSLVPLNGVTNIFKDFALNIEKNTIKLGIDEVDDNVRVTTSMLVCLLAAPSAGKSSITFGILNTISKAGIDGIFYSLDMAAPLVYQRLIQRHEALVGDVIFDMYKRNDAKLLEIEQNLANEYKNIKFCFKSGILISDIKDMIIKERTAGRDPKFIAIDYLECLQGPFSDSNANKAFIAQGLKDIANEFGVCVFLLVQPTKVAGDPSYELTSYRKIKGSSVIEEAASIIFTIHRPGFSPTSPEMDKFLNICVVKNRMGQLGSFDFAWDGLTGSITELDEYEKEELKKVREKNKERDSNKELF